MARAPERLCVLSRHVCRASECVEGQQVLDLKFSAEVSAALSRGGAIVALESTIISHGMPYPANLATAEEVERVVRSCGATPATIAIIAGRPCIGLSRQELELLARAGTSCRKVSRRDVLPTITSGVHGATTVAATMLLARAAGISVFVTGGIGGVHRGADRTMDVSADLTELGRTPIAVICAGAKSILDIRATLEVLETNGVTVVGYGTDEFPAFFTPHSGCAAHCRLDTPLEVARVVRGLPELGSGMVVGVPIPADQAADAAPTQAAIDVALREAAEKGVGGADITPYILERVRQLTDGKSLEANIRLIKNNASVGAAIAVALSKICTIGGAGRNAPVFPGRPAS